MNPISIKVVYVEHLKQVRAELSKRDLSTVPTEKLFDLFIKLASAYPGPELEYDLEARRLAGLDDKGIQIFAEYKIRERRINA